MNGPEEIPAAERRRSIISLSSRGDQKAFLREIVETPSVLDERATQTLVGCGLFVAGRNGEYQPSQVLMQWHEAGDSVAVAAHLHSQIRYIGELAALLERPRSVAQIARHAEDTYRLAWEGPYPIHCRLDWLRALDLVIYGGHEKRYGLTELGRKWVQSISLEPAVRLEVEVEAVALAPPSNGLAAELGELDALRLSQRHVPISYVIGHSDQLLTTLPKLFEIVGDGINSDHLTAKLMELYALKKGSVDSGLTFFRHAHFISRGLNGEVVVTSAGRRWAESKSPLDLARHLHCHVRLFGELLEVATARKTTKEIFEACQTKYEVSVARTNVRTRLQILRSLGLLVEHSGVHGLTSQGAALRNELPLERALLTDSPGLPLESRTQTSLTDISDRLARAAINSDEPNELESMVFEVFGEVGFQCEAHGGPGNTDVIASSPVSDQQGYSLAIDAKSTGHGVVTPNHIDFSALAEHREKHGATYSAVVAVAFNTKVVERAGANKIALISIETLKELLHRQVDSPLPLASLESLFRTAGLVDLSDVALLYDDRVRDRQLMQRTLEILTEEAGLSDEITQGRLNLKELHLLLRNDDLAPTQSELESVLQFLESPFVGAVARDKNGGYSTTGTLSLVGRRLKRLGTAMASSA